MNNTQSGRSDRSEPKLSVGTVMVLHAIARGHQYGFSIMEETGLTSGTIYPALDKLERAGYAKSAWEDASLAQAEKRPPRKYFQITTEGATALLASLDRYKVLSPLSAEDIFSHGAKPAS